MKKTKKVKKLTKVKLKKINPLKNKDLPVSQGQFAEFRGEVNSKFTSVELEFKAVRSEMAAGFLKIDASFLEIDARFLEVDARFSQIDARFPQIDARFSQIDARFSQIDARFSQIDSKLELLIAAVHQIRMLVEEQNARNKYVLDGFANLNAQLKFNKQETDTRIDQIEGVIKALGTKESI